MDNHYVYHVNFLDSEDQQLMYILYHYFLIMIHNKFFCQWFNSFD